MRARPLLPLAALTAASAWCVLLLAVRRYEYGDVGYAGLVWNLALAWVPLLLALVLVAAYRRGLPRLHLVAVGAAWLLFLPNAPYVLTDFVHLGNDHRLFDTVIIGSFAFTSLMLGLGSLLLVQLVVTRAAGAAVGWLFAVAALFLASVGIYLGRVERLNSWDLLQRPRLLASLAHAFVRAPLEHQYVIGFVLGVGVLLTLVYVGLYGFASLAASARRE